MYLNSVIVKLLPVAVVILLWEVAGLLRGIDAFLVPPPHEVLAALAEMLRSGQLVTDVFASLQRVFAGFLLASTLGLGVGLLLASFRHASVLLEPILELLRPIPPIAWIPLAILWFGIGEKPAYFIVFLGAFFPVFTSVAAGIRGTEQLHLNAARCLGASRWLIIKDIVLPSALPSVLTGLRIAFGVGWICVITAELVGAQSGLGYMIQLNRLLLRTDKVLAGMLVIGCLGFFFNHALLWIEKKLVRWKTATVIE